MGAENVGCVGAALVPQAPRKGGSSSPRPRPTASVVLPARSHMTRSIKQKNNALPLPAITPPALPCPALPISAHQVLHTHDALEHNVRLAVLRLVVHHTAVGVRGGERGREHTSLASHVGCRMGASCLSHNQGARCSRGQGGNPGCRALSTPPLPSSCPAPASPWAVDEEDALHERDVLPHLGLTGDGGHVAHLRRRGRAGVGG